MSETDLSRAIHKALQSLGYIVIRVQSGKVRVAARGKYVTPYWVQLAEKGCPDRVVLGPDGVTTWLEVKTAKGRLSPEQKAWHARARRMGHRVAVVHSVAEAIIAVAPYIPYSAAPAGYVPPTWEEFEARVEARKRKSRVKHNRTS